MLSHGTCLQDSHVALPTPMSIRPSASNPLQRTMGSSFHWNYSHIKQQRMLLVKFRCYKYIKVQLTSDIHKTGEPFISQSLYGRKAWLSG
jgi:hypothetical protein